MPDKPAGKKAAAQLVKCGAVEVFVHLLKDSLRQLRDILPPIPGKELFQIRLIGKGLHDFGIAGGHVDMMNLVKILNKDGAHVHIGQAEKKIILTGQHAEVKKGDREKRWFEKLVHVEFLDQKSIVKGDGVMQGQLIDKFFGQGRIRGGQAAYPGDIGLQVEVGQMLGNGFMVL